MNSTTDLGPDMYVEIHRYSTPSEMWAFHRLQPVTPDSDWAVQPFADLDAKLDAMGKVEGSPVYAERSGDLHYERERTQYVEDLISKGFEAYTLERIPQPLRDYVINCQAPLEWQKGLEAGEAEVTTRIKVWVKGEFPC
jgi:hypothetical protein